jgi:hypothetical protein
MASACCQASRACASLRLNLYTAAPGTPVADGLKLLAIWAATRAADNTGTRGAHDVR